MFICNPPPFIFLCFTSTPPSHLYGYIQVSTWLCCSYSHMDTIHLVPSVVAIYEGHLETFVPLLLHSNPRPENAAASVGRIGVADCCIVCMQILKIFPRNHLTLWHPTGSHSHEWSAASL
jgi:hypothetical protein